MVPPGVPTGREVCVNHVVTQAAGPWTLAGGRVELHQVPAAHDNFVWLLVDLEAGEAAAVDGPGDTEVLAACERLGVKLTTLFTTHTHGDHVGLHHALQRRGLLDGMRVVGNPDRASEIPGLNTPVGEGDEVSFGGVPFRVWLTEGHLGGHLSYVSDEVVFCGDVMFAGGCGRIFEGTPEQLFASLLRLAEVPPATWVACAHEYTEANLAFAAWAEPDNPALIERVEDVRSRRVRGESTVPSTIAQERATNPYLRVGSAGVCATLAQQPGGAPAGWSARFAMLRALKDRNAHLG